MGDIVNNATEEEFLWSCTLTNADKEYAWAPQDPSDADDHEDDKDDPSVKPGHRLLLKSAILMPTAKEGDVSIVQIESEGYNKAKVVTPIVAMKAGADYQQYVDVLIPHNATFKLIQGEGPISLVGSHCVDFYGYKDVGGNYSDEDESMDTEDEGEIKKKSSKESPSKEKKSSPAKDGEKKASPSKEGEKKVSPTKDGDKKVSPTKDGDKKVSPTKDGEKKVSPTKDGEKKGSPAKDMDKKASPAKDEKASPANEDGKTAEKEREPSGGKKRKASEEKSKSAEKKNKSDS